jgi:hypothetical protein
VASPNNPFSGLMDEFSFYNRALSTNEIAAIYNAGSAGKTTSITHASPTTYLDTDQDGIPDFWEDTFTTNLVFMPSNNNDRNGDGFTDLEEYNDWLAVPHALTTVTNAVGVDLYQLCGQSGRLAFGVTNSFNGLVYLTNVLGSVTNTGTYSNSIAWFTPGTFSGTNFYGYAGFDLYVTNLDTAAYFGPVTVSVMVSAVPIAITPPLNIIELSNGVPLDPINHGGEDYYSFTVGTNDIALLFSVTNNTAGGPFTLVAKYGLPLPSLSSYDYISTSWQTGESILVTTNSMPVPVTNGVWYLGVVNVSGGTIDYTIEATAYNNLVPPVFLFPTNTTVTNILETVPVAISCVATDLDTPPLPLTFALVSGPPGLSISNGVIYWTPDETNGPSTNQVKVSVSNGAFSITNSFLVNVLESNRPPAFVFTNIPDQIVGALSTLTLANPATDPDIPVNLLTYHLFVTSADTNAPAVTNALINLTNGIITWTPTLLQAGTNYVFTTVVNDSNPWAVNTQSFFITNHFNVIVPPTLTGPQTNVVAPGGINWFTVIVPTNAIYSTNILLFATLPVNFWFSTNVPPTTNYALLWNNTGGRSVLSTNLATAPTNFVPGGIYYLGVQNTNSVAVTNAVEVDFALVYPFTQPILPVIPDQVITAGDTLIVTNTATDTNAGAVLVYTLPGAPAGAVVTTNGIISWLTDTNQTLTNVVITTIVTDTFTLLSATNQFTVTVLPLLGDDDTNVIGANSIRWFTIRVPANAVQATNILRFATAPLNLWFSTNRPPSITNAAAGDFEMITNSTSGSYVIGTNSVPTLVPGSRYYLGVQNPNSFPVTNSVIVRFHLVFPPPQIIVISSIIQTNISGSNGFLITWFAPAGDQFHLQWTPTLTPPVWSTFNGVISFTSFMAATNSQFQYFDDGSQTGGFGPMRFYRLQLLNSPTNTEPFFLTTPVLLNASPLVPFVFTNAAKDWDIPAQTLTYAVTNTLAGTNVVTFDAATGVISWTPTAAQLGLTNVITTIVTDNGVPAKSATNVIPVVVAPPVTFSSITVNGTGVHFQWTAVSSEQFQIRWTTNLAPVNWHLFTNIITSATSSFSFVDTNTAFLMKFYQLILLP